MAAYRSSASRHPRTSAPNSLLPFVLGDTTEVRRGVGGAEGERRRRGNDLIQLGRVDLVEGVVRGVMEVEVLRRILRQIDDRHPDRAQRPQIGAMVLTL